jgi:oxygen-independent coproporphyrinogen-3 oxidase
VRTGTLSTPESDVAAVRYRTADGVLADAGFEWYELSSWAREPAARCTHNLLYWRNHNWLGVGPAAHGHLSGLRWWNHRDLASWTGALADGRLGAQDHEVVGADGRELERVMLGMRLREGLQLDTLDPGGVADLVSTGWAQRHEGHLVLTLEGRLLADAAVRRLCGDQWDREVPVDTAAPDGSAVERDGQKSVRSSS